LCFDPAPNPSPKAFGEGQGRVWAKLAARREGISRAELDDRADNEGAVRFYERCGFKPYARNMYREI